MKYIRLTIAPEDKVLLPYAHFSTLQGVVYALTSFDPELSAAIHDKKQDSKAAIKLFCFSDLIGPYENRREEKLRVFEEPFGFEVRSADDKLIETIEKRVAADNTLFIGSSRCGVTGFETGRRRFIESRAVFSMNTPITVYRTEDGFRRYYAPDEPEFLELIENNLRHKYFDVFGEEYTGEFKFKCLRKGRNVETWYVKRSDRDPSEKIRIKIRGWLGRYLLCAEPGMIETAYFCGVGGNNSQGFGFGEVDTASR